MSQVMKSGEVDRKWRRYGKEGGNLICNKVRKWK